MQRHRVATAFCVFGVGCAGVLAALLGIQTDAAAGQVGAAKATIVTVTAGKPSEFAFKLSKSSSITAGPVTFKVTNQGVLTHDFKICSTTTTSTTPKNSCVGRVTPVLPKGKTASLTITLAKGVYEFLSTEPADAKHGMKGLLGVGVKAPKSTAAAPAPIAVSTTPKGATTTTTPAVTVTPVVLIGDPVNGALVYHSAGCDSCHHLQGAGPNSRDGANLDTTTYATQAPYVTEITNGDSDMPAYASTLTQSQINDVAAFVFQASHR